MKLYTEEQVIKMIEKSKETGLTADFLILTTTPIEPPTDDEIKKSTPYPLSKGFYNPLYSNKWEEGAKWMRDKIQGEKI
jgi:hypothetical protein